MQTIRERLSYANVMSSLAVFLVLGGASAFAASQLAKNSVGSRQLKRNAVTAAKIKKNAVTGAKVKNGAITTSKIGNGAVTGAKVNLATLGTVPSAAAAGTLSGYDRGSARATATPGASTEAAFAAAPEVPIVSTGPISLYGKCIVVEGVVRGSIFVRTAVDGVALAADSTEFNGEPFLGTTTPEAQRSVVSETAGPNVARLYGNHTPEMLAFAPDGTSVWADNVLAVKSGNIPGGNGPFGAGDVCLFSGQMTALNG